MYDGLDLSSGITVSARGVVVIGDAHSVGVRQGAGNACAASVLAERIHLARDLRNDSLGLLARAELGASRLRSGPVDGDGGPLHKSVFICNCRAGFFDPSSTVSIQFQKPSFASFAALVDIIARCLWVDSGRLGRHAHHSVPCTVVIKVQADCRHSLRMRVVHRIGELLGDGLGALGAVTAVTSCV